MTVEPSDAGRRRRRPAKKSSRLRIVLAFVVALLIFALGVALGQALENGVADGPVTYRRTFSVPDETVTVTVPG